MRMKLAGKPISSPGRTEKFPPLLMRFLRSNVGSRSRGRSRSSPMFMRKKNTTIETQEPSSPKVTCIGQVRVRRSSKQPTTKPRRTQKKVPTKRRCKWIRNAFSFRHFPWKIKPISCRPVWCKWAWFFGMGCCKKSEIRQDSPPIASKFGDRSEAYEKEDEDDEAPRKSPIFISSSSTPPKNALLLTRCRSAPYRSSSLASRFWASPLNSQETGEEQEQIIELENCEDCSMNEKPDSEMESISHQKSRIAPEFEKKLTLCKEFEDSSRARTTTTAKVDELKTVDEDSVRPLVLTRCKSEPARTAQKLNPELNFWKQKRLDAVDSCLATVL